jgi:AcrR family transcriptional regulator
MSLLAEQMAERRQRILAAARVLIARRGVEGLTMRELAYSARLTVPTVYNLVGSRDAVVAAAIEEQIARFEARTEQASRAGQPASRALAAVEACVDELLRLPDYYPALLRFLATSRAARDARERVDAALGRELATALDALAAAGQLADWADPATIAARLRAHLSGAALEWAAGELDATAFRATALLDACLLLTGVTRGASQRAFARVARRAQRAAARPGRRGQRARRGRAAAGSGRPP